MSLRIGISNFITSMWILCLFEDQLMLGCRDSFHQNSGSTQIRHKFQGWTTTSIQTKPRLGVLWKLRAFPTFLFPAISIRAICYLRLCSRASKFLQGTKSQFSGMAILKVFKIGFGIPVMWFATLLIVVIS